MQFLVQIDALPMLDLLTIELKLANCGLDNFFVPFLLIFPAFWPLLGRVAARKGLLIMHPVCFS